MRKLDKKRIKKAKKLHDIGVPIAEVARQMGVSRTTIYAWFDTLTK